MCEFPTSLVHSFIFQVSRHIIHIRLKISIDNLISSFFFSCLVFWKKLIRGLPHAYGTDNINELSPQFSRIISCSYASKLFDYKVLFLLINTFLYSFSFSLSSYFFSFSLSSYSFSFIYMFVSLCVT